MSTATFAIVARTSILKVPESYPSFESTGLPLRTRLPVPFVPANRRTEQSVAPTLELGAFAVLLNQATHDDLASTNTDDHYRIFSRLKLVVQYQGNEFFVVPIPIETHVGVEHTPIKTFVPPPAIVDDLSLLPVSMTRYDFRFLVKARPHPLAEVMFEEVCHRDCVYIWHRVQGSVLLIAGVPKVFLSIEGSRFPSHAVFVNEQRIAMLYQGALGNLWVSDSQDESLVTASGPAEYSLQGLEEIGKQALGPVTDSP